MSGATRRGGSGGSGSSRRAVLREQEGKKEDPRRWNEGGESRITRMCHESSKDVSKGRNVGAEVEDG